MTSHAAFLTYSCGEHTQAQLQHTSNNCVQSFPSIEIIPMHKMFLSCDSLNNDGCLSFPKKGSKQTCSYGFRSQNHDRLTLPCNTPISREFFVWHLIV